MLNMRSGLLGSSPMRYLSSTCVARSGTIELSQALKQMRALRIERVPDLPYQDVVPLAAESHRGNVEIDEDKAPVVMLHGIWGHGEMFGNAGRVIASTTKRDFISCDLRNHGCSPLAAPHNYTAMAQDTIAFVEKMDKPVVLAGYLMGAKVAMLATLMRPDLFEQLIVVDNSPVFQDLGPTFTLILLGMANIERDNSLRKMPQQQRLHKIDQILRNYVDDFYCRQYLGASLNRRRTYGDNLPGAIYKAPVLNFLKDGTLGEVSGWPDELTEGLRFEKPVHVLRGVQSGFVTDHHLENHFTKYFGNVSTTDYDTGHFILAEKPKEFIEGFTKSLK